MFKDKSPIMPPTKTRGIRYVIRDNIAIALLDEANSLYNEAFCIVSKYLHENYCAVTKKNMKELPFEYWDMNDQGVTFIASLSTVYHSEEADENGKFRYVKKELTEACKENLTAIGIMKNHRNISLVVMRNYYSYFKRNKSWPKAMITVKELKGMSFYDGNVKDDETNLTLTVRGLGLNIVAPYEHPGTVANHKPQDDNSRKKRQLMGGTILKEKGIYKFTAMVTKGIDYLYPPIDWLGTDINKTNNKWIVCVSDNVNLVIEKPQKIIDVEDHISDVCTLLNKKNRGTIKGGYRQKLNFLRVELHRQHTKLIKAMVDEFLDMIVENKLGLVIDNIATGQSSGTFGQDKITKLWITECENRGIPFAISQPSYTSQICSECGCKDKKNRKSTQEFECIMCGYEECAHVNAAKNTRNQILEKLAEKEHCNV